MELRRCTSFRASLLRGCGALKRRRGQDGSDLLLVPLGEEALRQVRWMRLVTESEPWLNASAHLALGGAGWPRQCGAMVRVQQAGGAGLSSRVLG